VIESVQRTVALILMHVAQAEPQEARAAVLGYAENEEETKAVVRSSFDDPQVAKVCGERDFFMSRLFGKAA
jgi:hypothetical protein